MAFFARRSSQAELMDDFSITGKPLHEALDDLRWVNRYLGGYRAVRTELDRYLRGKEKRTLRLLDVGTGVADYPEILIEWLTSAHPAVDVGITAIDANEAAARYARQRLDDRLPSERRRRITVDVADARELPYADDSFDLAAASMFLHHFSFEDVTGILQEMHRVTREGIIVNDLHRQFLAYTGFWLLSRLVGASKMVKHDGPLSVRRAFRRKELVEIARASDLPNVRIYRRWAFRWVMTNAR